MESETMKSTTEQHRWKPLNLTILSYDSRGIRRALADQVSSIGGRISRLTRARYSAAMSGENLDRIDVQVWFPGAVRLDKVADALEKLADAVGWDLDVSYPAAAA